MNILIWMALHFVLRSKTKHQNLLLHLSTVCPGHLSFQSFTANINVDQKKKKSDAWINTPSPRNPTVGDIINLNVWICVQFIFLIFLI